MPTVEEREPLRCSFCDQSQKEVKKLILGPGVYICDECVVYCDKIVDEAIWGSSTSLKKLMGQAQNLLDSPVLKTEISQTPSLDRLNYAGLLSELALAIQPSDDTDSVDRR